jgi:predicted nucleic acid-binding protein
MVGLLVAGPDREALAERLRGAVVHVPAHFEAEVLSALGRLHRAGQVPEHVVEEALDRLARVPWQRHPIADLLVASWRLRGNIRLVDAIYVALAERLDARLLTLDRRLAASSDRVVLVVP